MALSQNMRNIADNLLAAFKSYVARSVAPLEATQRDLLARIDKSAAIIESLERRASRHGDHLSRMESRLQAIEHSKGSR